MSKVYGKLQSIPGRTNKGVESSEIKFQIIAPAETPRLAKALVRDKGTMEWIVDHYKSL